LPGIAIPLFQKDSHEAVGHFAHHYGVYSALDLGLEHLAAKAIPKLFCKAPVTLVQGAKYDQRVLVFLHLPMQPGR
jgi:hypothetical protein